MRDDVIIQYFREIEDALKEADEVVYIPMSSGLSDSC
jgi:fatty acid-binding protein DegV